ncbi:MAG: sigma 54-dependent Fis family transcriptional regulator [Myxococcaceae bacterium]|nr:sigma 54-dependent Fis family transcriptional regulator [Myxococcaceae bacterium]
MTTQQTMQQVGLPLKALSVTVLDGPDQGKRCMSQSERLTIGTANDNDLALTDPAVSRYHLELTRAGDRVSVRDVGSTNGTLAGAIALERGTVVPGTPLKIGRTTIEVSDGQTLELELHPGESIGPLKGRTEVMRLLMTKVARVGKSDVAVLLNGESGTGKELLAQALHEQSPRAAKPFVTVDCGSLAPGLVASELFGHERGAFTGADRRHVGAFERADGGTLFLDEIGELPAALQSTLLGVLERKTFRRVGGADTVTVDVRVVSATHRDLRAEVNSGAFRLDLFYRLAVVKLEVPPLRDRPEDVPLLVEHFLKAAGHDGPVEDLISPRAMEALKLHYWPGNVRELRNLVEATLAMGEPPPLESGSAPAPQSAAMAVLDTRSYKDARAGALTEFEKKYLGGLIDRAKGNVSEASRLARMDRSHLIELLKKHGLK